MALVKVSKEDQDEIEKLRTELQKLQTKEDKIKKRLRELIYKIEK